VETTPLERSVLEGKDRTELQSIATAMGGKPGSRARKADIVDMILGLAGVDGPDNGNGSKPEPAETSDSAGSDADDESSDGGKDDTKSEGGSDRGGEGAKRQRNRTSDRTGDGQQANKGQNGRGQGNRDQDAKSQGDTDQGDTDQGDTGQGDTDQDARGQGNRGQGNRGQGNKGQGNKGQGGGQKGNQRNQGKGGGQDQPESGNRRRRRRGRNPQQEREEEPWQGEPVEVEGLLDLRDDGYGFIRTKGFLPTDDDVYLSVKQVRQFGLRKGDLIKGGSRPANRNEKNPGLLRVDAVNGEDPEKAKNRPLFEDLTPLFPDEPLRLERPGSDMTSRIIDLISPIGKGQRGLIVSPPKAGKTTVMKTIAQSIEANNPEVHLIVALVDERPEEVTVMRRTVKGEVVASTFDRPSDEHTTVAELTIERAKRLVERGQDVVIILDGITRLARAYNLAAPATGRIMSGGLDTGALYPPKRFFGAARNIEEGGSLTILATALVETGSKMDEVIFEEFKGTGNMELRLDRHLAERRIYPAIDVDASSTRHEELLYERNQLQMIWKLRRVLGGLASDSGTAAAGLEMLIDRLGTFESNAEFLAEVAKAPSGV
jgi:transcription termination factor Rho